MLATLAMAVTYQVFRRQLPANQVPVTIQPEKSNEETPPANTLDYQIADQKMRISWFLADPTTITLIPNYFEKRTARDIKEIRPCQNLTSAGFYATDGSPLGLVITDYVKLADFAENALLNGVFSITKDGTPVVSTQATDSHRLALQAGPILIYEGLTRRLSIKSDEPSRRLVVGVTDANKLIFLAFYIADNPYQGPLLSELPQHLKKFQVQSGISIVSALNLDGGSASAFASDGLFLEELTTVGSFFCAQ